MNLAPSTLPPSSSPAQEARNWHERSLQALSKGQLIQAIAFLEQAVSLDSSQALFHRNLGEMNRRAKRLPQAIAAGQRAVALSPGDVDSLYNLALAHADAGNMQDAERLYQAALDIRPGHALSWNNLGACLEARGDAQAALQAYERATQVDPKHAEAFNNAGVLRFQSGQLPEARHLFESAILVRPGFVEAHFNLSSLKTYTPDDPHIAALEQLTASLEQMSDEQRIRLCFAYGKALEDIKAYDQSFAFYEAGNRLHSRRVPVDEPFADMQLAEIKRVFDAALITDKTLASPSPSEPRTPIFIVGMPRSGTTLLEQILCSHASVHGAGELMDLHEIVKASCPVPAGRPFTDTVHGLTPQDLQRMASDYLTRVWKHSPASQFITDKMPGNFFYIGLIRMAMPNAKIIHAIRDPMDSCFSCYARLFTDTMGFAYEQGTLGRYYARYMQLMMHWQEVLPAGSFLNVRYEDLVSDTEGEARKILAYVGLPWDPACLDFHKNDRVVRTASVAQVRRPIYKTSLARWRHYAKHLRPLLRIVAPYRDGDPADAEQDPAPQQHITAEALNLAGLEHYRNNRFEAALISFNDLIRLQPEHAPAYNSRGFVLQDMGQLEAAMADFQKAVFLDANLSAARLNLSMIQLKLGLFREGWANYEARWTGSVEAHRGAALRVPCPLPTWAGETVPPNQSILVVTEQGFGDTFQFARYLPMLTKVFARVGFACSEPTARLMEWSFGEQVVLLTHMPAQEIIRDAWDFQCPLMSLPKAFDTSLASIPAQTPYMKVSEPARLYWGQRVAQRAKNRLRIGLAWSGRKEHQFDHRRSLSFSHMAAFLKVQGITWFSLQKWHDEGSAPLHTEGLDWADWTSELCFASTAALVEQMDLVISIDSAMVHLAGALNRPVWLMDRFDNEWRWLHGRDDSPWYPSLRIFRQKRFGQWEEVMQRIAMALQEHVPDISRNQFELPLRGESTHHSTAAR